MWAPHIIPSSYFRTGLRSGRSTKENGLVILNKGHPRANFLSTKSKFSCMELQLRRVVHVMLLKQQGIIVTGSRFEISWCLSNITKHFMFVVQSEVITCGTRTAHCKIGCPIGMVLHPCYLCKCVGRHTLPEEYTVVYKHSIGWTHCCNVWFRADNLWINTYKKRTYFSTWMASLSHWLVPRIIHGHSL